MWSRIAQELTAIEAAHQVRIVLAVESGSRAWRFPSQDSDYDVRFIYLRPAQDYLAVTPLRDVIEKPLDAVLDINGWDIRKALGLMAGSNAVLQEWLTSPIRYRADAGLVDRLQALAQETADPAAFRYHYDRMARRHFEAILETETPRLKSYFYALRPVFALHWLNHRQGLPPMDLPSLMAGSEIGDDLRQRIDKMVARKAEAGEQAAMARNPVLDDFIATNLRDRADRPPADRAVCYDAVNAFFSGLVKDDLAAASSAVR
jgi:hypothetical protein